MSRSSIFTKAVLLGCVWLLGAGLATAAVEPVEGRDYTLINPAVATSAEAGKIEVLEVFGYSCAACAALQPSLEVWKAKLPADVEFRYQPAAFGGVWDMYARAYFAAEALGLLEASHGAIFKAIHTERRPLDSIDSIAGLYADFGADPATVLATMQSFAVNAKLARARETVQRFGSDSTPEMIINGRYRVSARQAGGFARQLEVTDALIARERATRTPL